MKCPVCQSTFKYNDIPIRDKRARAWYTIIKCPNCSNWLKPAGYYSYFTTGGLAIAVTIFSVIVFYYDDLSYAFTWLLLLFAAAGVFGFIYGAVAIKLKMLGPEEMINMFNLDVQSELDEETLLKLLEDEGLTEQDKDK